MSDEIKPTKDPGDCDHKGDARYEGISDFSSVGMGKHHTYTCKDCGSTYTKPVAEEPKEQVKFAKNGQWSLHKGSVNPALAPKEVKIKELQSKIDAGTYKPDASKIADKMLDPKGK